MKDVFAKKIEGLKSEGLYRFLKTVDSDQGPEISCQGKKYLNFSSNNYLGLANHPQLTDASIKATKEFGTSSGASRLITGSMTLTQELEAAIAKFKGSEAALVFNSGYHANLGIISALMGEGDTIFSDEWNHASLIDGCRLSKAPTQVYRHGDSEHLESLLKKSTSIRKLITTDSVFSMDGDLCPLPQIMKLAERYDAWVLVDEAHATGVFGKQGRGVVEHFGVDPQNPRLIQMGTFGKALGSFGAYVCGPRAMIDYLINRARTFIYTTALPPSVMAASLAAIKLIEEDFSLKEKLWENVEYFKRGLDALAVSPIIPIIIGDAQRTIDISNQLFESGIWATGIRPPTVPNGTSRIRFTIMATHTREQLDKCLTAIANCEFGIAN